MDHKGLRRTLALTAGLLLSLAPAARAAQVVGPPVPVDEFHPDKEKGQPEPAYGGSVVVHLSSAVEGLNRAVENSAVSNWMLYEVHDRLVLQNWESWEIDPSLAESWSEEDQLILKPGADETYPAARKIGTGDKERLVLYGSVQAALQAAGLTLHHPIVDEMVTSLDMAGCSLSLLWLDDELKALFDAPCASAAYVHA